jgi:hypothetical protein
MPSPDKRVDLRIAHLNMIQGAISRMSGFSASAKNFCITVSAAIIAVAFQKPVPWLGGAALMVLVLFCLMDAYYLSLERRYRAHYEDVASRDYDVVPDMSLTAGSLTWKGIVGSIVSMSVFPFYLLLMASMGGLLYLASHVEPNPPKAAPVSNRGPPGPAGEGAGRPPAITARRGPTEGAESAPAERLRQPVFDANATGSREPVRRR